jgi:hypothetical protein
VRVSLRGDDPMNIVRFGFNPGVLDVPPGAVTTALVTVEAPRAAAGQEVNRPFAVIATDGRAETTPAEGSMTQAAPVRTSYARQIWRVLLTLFGGLMIIIGAVFLPFQLGGDTGTALGFDADDVSEEFRLLRLSDFLPFDVAVLSVGLVLVALAVIMMFGLTGPKGRLTRLMAILTALIVVAIPIAFAVFSGGISLDSGFFVILVGCVLGYVGGMLVKR